MSNETALDWLNRAQSKCAKNQSTSSILPSFLSCSLAYIWEDATDAFLNRETNISLQQRSTQQHRTHDQADHDHLIPSKPPHFIFQEGTRVRFVDEILCAECSKSATRVYGTNDQQITSTADSNDDYTPPSRNVVLEITGVTGVGKTALSISLAASYVAATSNFLLQNVSFLSDNAIAMKAKIPPPPQVIILDSDYGIHACQLASAVRASVVRMWEKQQNHRNRSHTSNTQTQHSNLSHCDPNNRNDENINNLDPSFEKQNSSQINHEILSCLSRIHIAHPRDLGCGYVSCIEAIKYALDSIRTQQSQSQKTAYASENFEEPADFQVPFLQSIRKQHPSASSQKNKDNPSPPIMLIIDSLNTFQYHDQMLEDLTEVTPTQNTNISDPLNINQGSSTYKNYSSNTKRKNGSGLSGRNDFLRQLERFLQSQNRNIILIATKSMSSKHSNNNTNNSYYRSKDPWNKLVTHRVCLDRVKMGTDEQKLGYEFVALFQKKVVQMKNADVDNGGLYNVGTFDHKKNCNESNNVTNEMQIVPFSVTSYGILC